MWRVVFERALVLPRGADAGSVGGDWRGGGGASTGKSCRSTWICLVRKKKKAQHRGNRTEGTEKYERIAAASSLFQPRKRRQARRNSKEDESGTRIGRFGQGWAFDPE